MSEKLRVLVVDDEKISRRTTVQRLRGAGYQAEEAENAFVALELLAATTRDVVLTDLRMPGMDGLALMRETRARSPETEVIVMTAFGSVETAVLAMQQGAADYLTKPFSFAELEVRLGRLASLRDSRIELMALRAIVAQKEATLGLFGNSPALARIRDRIQLFAASAAPVLVTGDTGTGKELVARAIHRCGPRRDQPFLAVACGAIARDLAESELLGHEKGAFTGALARHLGCFEQANCGTLLLDDVDDLPLETQVKLLRVLQEGIVRRVGGTVDIVVDVRIVATTKVNLEHAVANGRFRKDLFYRLRGLEIALQPLRERGDDVVLLAHHFLESIAVKTKQPQKRLTPEAAEMLRRHAWPGNVRELWRTIESAVALCPGLEIRSEHLPDFLGAQPTIDKPYTLHLDGEASVSLSAIVEHFEDDIVQWAMQQAHGQQGRAAEILGIPRTTLQSKLARRKS